MKPAFVATGLASAALGVLLVYGGAAHNATVALYDPTVDTAAGDVHVLAPGDKPLLVPREMHRGATYELYDRAFTLARVPPSVASVDFVVFAAFAAEGTVPFPFAPRNLPASESFSGMHVEDVQSPWIPPFGNGTVGIEARHTFREAGEGWRARLEVDTALLPSGTRFDHVLGTAYVAHLADGTSWDLQGIVGAGEDHVLVLTEDDTLGRAVQAGGLPLGAVLIAGGFAGAAWGAFGARRPD
ncbi:MAG TPA: hypothetical protein VI997_10300 [Candidatus Thermoplasmatota archaeon]|nr:hypothetical protein [Candidatus Thermoplasmatota archaeon]